MKTAYHDLTEGRITPALISFGLPLLIGALIQQLYSTVDMMFVGRELGPEAAAAVGSSGMIVACLVTFFAGMSIGVSIIAGKAVGSRDPQKLDRVIHCAAAITWIMGGVLMLAGYTLTPVMLGWIRVPKELMPLALRYIRIYLCGILSIICYDVGTGILKAMGNSKLPTLFQLSGGIVNIIGNYLLIHVFGMGVTGAALTTVLSQSFAAILTVRQLGKLPGEYRLRLKKIRLERHLAGEILSVGLPSAFQAVAVSLSNAFVQAGINGLDICSIAGFTAYYKAENVVYYPIMAISSACSAFVSQNTGARKPERVRQGMLQALILVNAVTIALSIPVILGYRGVFALFSADPAVIEAGGRIVRVTMTFYFLYATQEILSACIRGSGNAGHSMIMTVISLGVIRVLCLRILLAVRADVQTVVWVYPITWVFATLMTGGYLLIRRRKRSAP